MPRKIATLEVYLADTVETAEERKAFSDRPFGSAFNKRTNQLVIAPAEDMTAWKPDPLTKQSFSKFLKETIAHELGHFLSNLLGAKEEEKLFKSVKGDLPSEELAWQNAESILGEKINEEHKTWALNTHKFSDTFQKLWGALK